MRKQRVVPIGSKFKIQTSFFGILWKDFTLRSDSGDPYVVEFETEDGALKYIAVFLAPHLRMFK